VITLFLHLAAGSRKLLSHMEGK